MRLRSSADTVWECVSMIAGGNHESFRAIGAASG